MAETNEQMGKYKLRTLLQTGQTSQVFECVEPISNRHFAMKVLLPEFAEDKAQRAVLFHEAKIGIKLRHENVIKIVEVNESMSNPFFVMEYFPAGSLRKRMFEKDFAFIKEHCDKIFKQMATGLAYMNSSGYVHCDVKPDNVLVNAVGELKLIDFAISKKVQKPGLLSKLFGGAKKGKAQGTPSFMSPEQLRGEALDGRADIYSFGATMFELLTARKPFTANSPNELMQKICVQKPDAPQMYNADLTDDVNALILRLLQKKRENRPATFHEVLMELRKIRIYKSVPKKIEAN